MWDRCERMSNPLECALTLIPRDTDAWALSSAGVETGSINGGVGGEKMAIGNARGVIWGWASAVAWVTRGPASCWCL